MEQDKSGERYIALGLCSTSNRLSLEYTIYIEWSGKKCHWIGLCRWDGGHKPMAKVLICCDSFTNVDISNGPEKYLGVHLRVGEAPRGGGLVHQG